MIYEDKYYLFLLSIVSLQPGTEPGREIGGAREILAEWVKDEDRKKEEISVFGNR